MTPPIADCVVRGVFEGIALPSPVARKSSHVGFELSGRADSQVCF